MITIALVGVILPGYLLARALGAPYCWVIAFPISVVLLAETVVVYTCVGIPLRFDNVLAALIAICLICTVAWLRRQPEAIAPAANSSSDRAPKLLAVIVFALAGVVLLGMLVRTSLFPLSGYDTAIRWDLLARLMLEHQGLSYYPLRTAEDFTVYPSFPDGFPPLVSTVYWWLYAAWGEPWAALTAAPVILQAICCFALVYRGASLLFGSTGGLVSLAVLAATPSFVQVVAMGQETGYTALCYAGQLTFALAATRQPRAGTIVIAGMFAALGALAREYGPLLSLAGFSLLACHGATRRYLPLFCLVAAVFGGIWYVRTWTLTGNPVYPLDVGFGLPTNHVYSELLGKYRQLLGIQTFVPADWGTLALQLLMAAPLVLFVGVPCIFAAGRNSIALAIAVGLVFFIWLWSIAYTAGGTIYSFRVLTPAYVALSISAGAVGAWLINSGPPWKTWLRAMATVVLLICGIWTALCSWSHPSSPTHLLAAVVSSRADPLDYAATDLKVAKQLEESGLPPTGVLTDSCYLGVALARTTRFHSVLIWSPAVSFLFDRHIGLAEMRQRLRANNILLISIANRSFNNFYLREFPFFSEDQPAIQPVLHISKTDTIFRLYPEGEKPQP